MTAKAKIFPPKTVKTPFGTWTIRDDRAEYVSRNLYGPPPGDYNRAVILYGPGYSSITTSGTVEIPPEIARLIAENLG